MNYGFFVKGQAKNKCINADSEENSVNVSQAALPAFGGKHLAGVNERENSASGILH